MGDVLSTGRDCCSHENRIDRSAFFDVSYSISAVQDLAFMECYAAFAFVTKITEPITPGGDYFIELEAERPEWCEWVELFTQNLGADLGKGPYLFSNRFSLNGSKRIVLRLATRNKPSAKLGGKAQVKWHS